MHQEHPEMVKDQYWDEVFPAELPYTVASKLYQTGPPPGSADNVEVSLKQAEFMPLETVAEEAQEELDELDDIEVRRVFFLLFSLYSIPLSLLIMLIHVRISMQNADFEYDEIMEENNDSHSKLKSELAPS